MCIEAVGPEEKQGTQPELFCSFHPSYSPFNLKLKASACAIGACIFKCSPRLSCAEGPGGGSQVLSLVPSSLRLACSQF